MTPNQTIDGVPGLRELLERLYAEHVSIAGPGFWVAWKELRALLDKEVSGDSRAPLPQGEPRAYDIESAARTLSECMDYSWGHMPEQGRAAMREYVALIIASALPGNAEQPASVAVVPDGYCIMPRQLTAENGAKALLLGEFKLLVTKECPECCELEEPTEGCSICDGEGEYGQKHTIPWDQIKCIYSKAISGLAVKTQLATSR